MARVFTPSERAQALLLKGYEDPARREYTTWRAVAIADAKGDERGIPTFAAWLDGWKTTARERGW